MLKEELRQMRRRPLNMTCFGAFHTFMCVVSFEWKKAAVSCDLK
jgi:hypothetical protein